MRMSLFCLLALSGPAVAPDAASDAHRAEGLFAQAQEYCSADWGRLWGVPLCGPVMLVDPTTRTYLANQQNEAGTLRPLGGVFAGTLEAGVPIANTVVEVDGMRWSQVLDDGAGSVDAQLLLHEMYHQIQPQLGHVLAESDNRHLDTLEGRYLLRLELAALRQALTTTGRSRLVAIADALAIRQARWKRFPAAARAEAELELNEGLAEYTAIVLAHRRRGGRREAALAQLRRVDAAPSLVRSFAYATGPAYGLLLDQSRRSWRPRVAGTGLDALLAETVTPAAVGDDGALADALHVRYGGAALRAFEVEREAQRRRRVEHYERVLVHGRTLELPNVGMNFSFNPSAVLSLGEHGNVHPRFDAKAEWGLIEVRDGALISADWMRLMVAAPTGVSDRAASGPGWTLRLATGWVIVDAGSGRLRVERDRPKAPGG